ncbi:DUF742 domain-containing protein [Streptomyces sp. NPDC093223]|uniref:DUF742 domain-containing protein n=1 Tax=Streptomyces sp. NPDC093223 TaxID=3366033 RepID=UPI00382BF65B
MHTGDPDRLHMLTGGRSRAVDRFDLVTLVTTTGEPVAGMQSEHTRILRLCERPRAVVEIAADLRLPLTVVRILLGDLLRRGLIRAHGAHRPERHPDVHQLRRVLHALQSL